MQIIATVDNNWAMRSKGRPCVTIPADLRFIRQLTKNKVLVMDKEILDNLPSGMPFAERKNIVFTTDRNFKIRGAEVVNDLESLRKLLSGYDEQDVFITGGNTLIGEFINDCDTLHITKVDHEYRADEYFPLGKEFEEFVIAEESEEQTLYDLEYYFFRFERKG